MKIIRAIQNRVANIPAIERIYIDLTPKEFKRPSLLIASSSKQETSAGAKTVKIEEVITLTLFVTVGEAHETGTEELLTLRDTVLRLFERGYLKVEDRALTFSAEVTEREWDHSTIELDFSYYDNRPEEEEEFPLMEEIDMHYEKKEKNDGTATN